MTGVAESPAAAAAALPQELERGRYVVYANPDGTWTVGRAAEICERCRECGCGTQAEPLTIPHIAVSLLTMDPDKRSKLNPMAVMKQLMGGHGGR